MVVLSVLLPTRGRPDGVRRLLDSIRATAARPADLEVVLYVDADDDTSRELRGDGIRLVTRVGPPGQPMGTMLGACVEASQGRHLMLLNDDVVCRTPGWDESVVQAFARFPDGVALVYGNDLDQGQRVPSFPIVSRRACDIMGELCPREYLNLHIESHLADIFRRLAQLGHDRRVYLAEAVFEHLHPMVGKARADATYVKRDPARDHQLYFALEDERQAMAIRLARHIERHGSDGRRVAAAGRRVKTRPAVTVLAGLDDRHPARLLRWLRTLQAAAGRMTSETIAIAAPAVGGTALDPDALADAVDEIVAGEPTWAGGVSAALARARGEYVAYVPAGASPQEGWLDHAVAAAGSAAVVGAKVLHPRNGRVLHAGVAFFEDDTGLWFVQLYRGFRGEHPAVNRRRVVQAVSPIGAVVRRQAAVEAIGGVPTDLESELLATIDLCVRVRERGQTVVYAPVTVGCDDAALLARARARGEPGRAARWLGRVEPDLERHLDDDGFALRREAATASYTIEPTRR